jgi:hypothetical protein
MHLENIGGVIVKKILNILIYSIIIMTIISSIVLFVISFQIGINDLDKPNRVTIISGLLSMIGGMVGALGAFFIARMQMTKQIDIQFEKEHKKMIIEIKIIKIQEAIKIYNSLQDKFQLIVNLYNSFNKEVKRNSMYEKNSIDLDDIYKNVYVKLKFQDKSLDLIKEFSDSFHKLFLYKYYYSEDFNKRIKTFYAHNLELFQRKLDNHMTLDHFDEDVYPNHICPITDFQEEWNKVVSNMDWEIEYIKSLLICQLELLEADLFEMLEIND